MSTATATVTDTDLLPVRYTHIAVHYAPHFEEIVGIWLLRTMPDAEKAFPGVSTAEIAYWGKGSATPDGQSAESWKQRGYLLLGVGGGEFDEHPTSGRPRREGESSLSLLAAALGLQNEPWLAKIIDDLTKEDLHAGSGAYSIMSTLKLLNEQNPENLEEVMDWAMMAIGAHMRKQREFHTKTRAEFDRKAKLELIPSAAGQLMLAVIESDDAHIGRYAFSKEGGKCDICVIKKSSGHVAILTAKRRGLDLRDMVRVIRRKEAELCGANPKRLSWKELEETEGTLDFKGADRWFYFLEGQSMLNGSRSARDVEPTAIPLADIVFWIKRVLNNQEFERRNSAQCQKGKCLESAACPWYCLGLIRCRSNHASA